jgi:hypothetical protein
MISKKINEVRVINLKNCNHDKAMEYLKTCFYGWAAMEQWNTGIYDMPLYFKSYPQAFYVLEVLSKDGKNYDPAAILFAPYDAETNQACIGVYISEQAKYRGKGYGYQLWKHVFAELDRLNPESTRYLYGVPQQVSNYAKSGFFVTHKIIHYDMSPSQKHGPLQTIIEKYGSKESLDKAVFQYLATNYSVGLAKFVKNIAEKKDVHIRVSIDPRTKEIIGVGMARPLHDGKSYRYAIVTQKGHIGAADDLFRALNRNLIDKHKVVIDVRDKTPSQEIYESYCRSENSSSKEKYGQHWTTEMSTNPLLRHEKLDINAAPSLDTNFIPITLGNARL